MKSPSESSHHELSSLADLDLPIIGKWIWLMMGITFVLTSTYLYFGEPEVLDGESKEQVAALFFLLGSGIFLNTLIIEPLKQKRASYKKKHIDQSKSQAD